MDRSRCHGSSSSAPPPENEGRDLFAPIVSVPPVATLIAAFPRETRLYLVGGTVRDTLAGIRPKDYDLAAALSAEQIGELLTSAGVRWIATGLRHGTVTAVVDGHNIEITSLRRVDERGAVVQGESIEEDLEARDFTINAIAFDLRAQKIIDPLGGREDLARDVLRAPGDPAARMREDPLRVLRAVRFGHAAGRAVDSALLEVMRRSGPALAAVSVERIKAELEAILLGRCPAAGIRALRDLGLLEHTIPSLTASVGFEQNEYHVEDVFEHTMTVLSRCEPDLTLRLAALFHDAGKPPSLTIGEDGRRHFYSHEIHSAEIAGHEMHRLRFSNDEIAAVTTIVRHHMRPIDCGAPGVRRILRDLGPWYEIWRKLKLADSPPVTPEAEWQSMLDRFDEMVRQERERPKGSIYEKLAIGGDDLIALGVPPGKGLGSILKRLNERVLDNPELNDRETLLTEARRMLDSESGPR